MKLLLLWFLLLFCLVSAAAQGTTLNIIPRPARIELLKGEFKFNQKTKIAWRDETGKTSANLLNEWLLKNYGFRLEAVKSQKNPENAIIFEAQKNLNVDAAAENYELKISDREVVIGARAAGQFYALQSLFQLLPLEFKTEAKIPALDIWDTPRFSYRGMHLDVSRHFFPVDFIKKYLDLMAQYKFNKFHWHLTDDQGWRIEIRKYPRLTEIGSRRPETMKEQNFQPYVGDGIPIAGFYTQEQIKEVVAYAKSKHITVIPEIELPGHSSAALAAYPEFGCQENYTYKVQTTWGIFKEVFCPTDRTFQFLEDVLSEVTELFPDSPYIHIGGDEVLKDHWKESAFVQELKRRENLKDEHEVQSYFIRRIEKFINSKGKKIIGWDEILEGGLAPNATVMSWRGEKGGIAAAKAGHDVIMTPTNALYFDYGQGDPKYEPINIGNHLTLETVYAYNPVPKELNEAEAKFILGAQGNVWTEYIKTPEKLEYMVFPRLLALSEVVWSPHEAKNFTEFQSRLADHFARLDKQNVNYRIPEPKGLRNMMLGVPEKAVIELETMLPNAKIFYTTDGTEPSEKSAEYLKPLEVALKPNEVAEVKSVVVNGKGRRSSIYAATIMRREPLRSVELTNKKEGVSLKFYKTSPANISDFEKIAPTETLETKSVQLTQFADKTNKFKEAFGADFDGYIYAPATAIYEFKVESDGQVILQIGGERLIALSGEGPKQIETAIIPLEKGFHKLNFRYLHTDGEAVLNFRWSEKGQGFRRIYGSELFH